VVAHETWPEYGLAGDGPGADPRGLGLAQGALPDGQEVWDTLDLAPDAALERAGLHPVPDLPRVRGLTVAGVSAAPRRARTLDARYGADVESMEGFAVAWACALAGTPCVQARIVSNLAGARPPEHWDLDGALAALPGLLERLLAPRP
jgi:futalosine hydrolase